MKRLACLQVSLVMLVVMISVPHAEAQDNEVPDVYTLPTQFERVEVIRMRSGTDMLEGLKKAVEKENIKNGVILNGIGSVTDYNYHVVSSRSLPAEEEFHKASRAVDLVAVQGYILNKRVHAHITLSDENNSFGGHLEPGTKALTFFIITVGVLPDEVDIHQFDNSEW